MMIVNDFGAINIDANLLNSVEDLSLIHI